MNLIIGAENKPVNDNIKPTNDRALAEHYRSRLMKAQETINRIMDEAFKDGFQVNIQTGRNEEGIHVMGSMTIFRVY